MFTIAKPVLGEEEAEAAREAILSGWVTQGPRVELFEHKFAGFIGGVHACAVSNCTAALHLGLKVAGVRPGDTVITVSFSFIATANAIRYCMGEPVFVDVDPQTGNLSPAKLEELIEKDFKQTSCGLEYQHVDRLKLMNESPFRYLDNPKGRLAAVLVVHQMGMPADMPALSAVCKKYDIPLIEDAACAIGSKISIDDGKTFIPIGSPLSELACFSFHPRKVITTGEGGMIVTSSSTIDEEVRRLRHHAMNISDVERHKNNSVLFEEYTETAYNYRMTDIQAAIGHVQLDRVGELVVHRRRLADVYAGVLKGANHVKPPHEPEECRSNWQSYMVLLDKPEMQRPVMEALSRQGISTRRGIMCSHLEAPYEQSWSDDGLSVSRSMRDRGVILPLHHGISESDAELIGRALLRVCNG